MLNKSKGNMYPWVTDTWNPIKGVCSHGCSYCFMRKWGNLKSIRLETSEFKTDLGKGNFIFVGSSTDDWAAAIPDDWILKTLDYCNKFENRYLFQSKNPSRILEFSDHPVFRRSVVCTTIESNRFYPDVMNNSPKIEERVKAMAEIATKGIPVYVTCEPLMQFDLSDLVGMLKECKPKQVNIGRNSRRDVPIPEPTADEVKALKAEIELFTKVEVKKNANIWMK